MNESSDEGLRSLPVKLGDGGDKERTKIGSKFSLLNMVEVICLAV